jgi:hypothetical protein
MSPDLSPAAFLLLCLRRQTFFKEKSLTKNLFNRLIFVLLPALTMALSKSCVRWPRQDDGAVSGFGKDLPG